jgi:hypothetical protein
MAMDELVQLARAAQDAADVVGVGLSFAEGDPARDDVPPAFDLLKNRLGELIEKLEQEEEAREFRDDRIKDPTDKLFAALLALHCRATEAGTVSLAEVHEACFRGGMRGGIFDAPLAKDDEPATAEPQCSDA